MLKICNWPDSTTCISDLLVRPRTGADPGSSQFSKDILHALRAAATETPVIVNITPANKLSKRILSLFQSKQRKSFNKRIRTNNFNNGDKLSQRPRTSSFTSRNRESDSYSEAAPPSPTAAPAPAHTTSRRRNPYQAASTTTTATRAAPVTTESPRVRIRPFSLRKRPSPLRSRSESEQRTEAVTMQSVFRQLPGASAKLAEAEEDVVTKVRSESSVSSVSSYVRVSVGDLASLQSGTPSLPSTVNTVHTVYCHYCLLPLLSTATTDFYCHDADDCVKMSGPSATEGAGISLIEMRLRLVPRRKMIICQD